MAEQIYTQAFVREVNGENDKGRKVRKGWQLVCKYKQPNPNFKPKPEGKDTRKPSEKRRDVWRQVTKVSHARTKTAATKELQAWREELEAEASMKQGAGTTVAEAVAAYIDRGRKVDGRELSKSTLLDYRFVSGYLARGNAAVADMELSKLTPKSVRAWEDGLLDDGLSSTTCAKAHRLLHLVCQDAVIMGDLTHNPCQGVRPPKRNAEAQRNPNALNHEGRIDAVNKLASMSLTPKVVAAQISLYCALRQGEACGLTWANCDLEGINWEPEQRYQSITFDGPKLRVCQSVGRSEGGCFIKQPKTSNGYRVIPICGRLLDVLKERRAAMWAEWSEAMKEAEIEPTEEAFSQLYVVGNIDGSFLNPMSLSRSWSTTAKDLGLVGSDGRILSYHDLRRTWPTVADSKGVSSKTTKYVMGHSERDVTSGVYTAPDADAVLRAANLVARELDGTRENDVIPFRRTGTEG